MAKLLEAQEIALGINTGPEPTFGNKNKSSTEESRGRRTMFSDQIDGRGEIDNALGLTQVNDKENGVRNGTERERSRNTASSRGDSIMDKREENADSDDENDLFDTSKPITNRRPSRMTVVDSGLIRGINGLTLGVSVSSMEAYLKRRETAPIQPSVDNLPEAALPSMPPEKNSSEATSSNMDDVAVFQSLKWVKLIFESNDFHYCFEHLPTVHPDTYYRDEVSQVWFNMLCLLFMHCQCFRHVYILCFGLLYSSLL